jgi:hypothetical protein
MTKTQVEVITSVQPGRRLSINRPESADLDHDARVFSEALGRPIRYRDVPLQALDTIEALRPNAVIAGHGVLDPDSSPRHIVETRRYLRDFAASLAST